MKLYSYSSGSLAVKREYWAGIRCIAAGMFLGAIIFFGSYLMDHSVENTYGQRTVNALTVENTILRHEIYLLSPRVNTMEITAGKLREQSNVLRISLNRSTIAEKRLADLLKPVQGPASRSLSAVTPRFRR